MDRPPHQVGDLVMLVDSEFKPRNRWPIGRIMEVLPGKDGKIRIVTVKTSTPIGGSTTLLRPISKLILLKSCSELEGK